MTIENPLYPEGLIPFHVPYVGCDPEFLYEDANGKLIPSFSVLGEKKEEPHYPYIDGWQGEFGTRPTHCIAYMMDDVQHALKLAAAAIGDAGKISTRSVLDVDISALVEQPEHSEFGCTPSLNAYDSYIDGMPGTMVPFRMAGGHIHLGIPSQLTDSQWSNMRATSGYPAHRRALDTHHKTVVKFLDRVAGVVGAAMFSGMEDVRRRLLYGRAGEYRLPAHGLEYRVPSNAWLCHPAVAHFYVHLVRKACGVALGELVRGEDPINMVKTTDDEVIAAINESNPTIARGIISNNKRLFECFITDAACHLPVAVAAFERAIMADGVYALLPENYTFYKAWMIDTSSKWYSHSGSDNCCISRSVDALRKTGRLAVNS